MKRPYSHRRSLPRSVWGFGVAIFVVLILGALRLFIPGAFFALSSPLWNSGTALTASTGNVFAGFAAKEALVKENRALTAQITELTAENAALTTRTQDLTKLLGGQSDSASQQGMAAGVIARPPESPYDTLTVAKGQADGVTIGVQVYGPGGIPIGTIKHTTAHTAQVSLYSSPGRETSGWAGATRTPITLVGQGAGSFDATIPKAAAIAVGDVVYVPGPGALPIGTVVNIATDPSSPNDVVHIQPSLNLFSITWVLIGNA